MQSGIFGAWVSDGKRFLPDAFNGVAVAKGGAAWFVSETARVGTVAKDDALELLDRHGTFEADEPRGGLHGAATVEASYGEGGARERRDAKSMASVPRNIRSASRTHRSSGGPEDFWYSF